MKFLVDSHTHTISSGHAYSTVLENAQAAADAGLEAMCITDHAPSMPGAPHYWHIVNQRVIPEHLYGVRILRGVEANILNAGGDIDLPDYVIGQIDWVIASFHEAVFSPKDKAHHTVAMIAAIESGKVDAIGHPGNPAFDIDFVAVVEAAVKHKVAIEINNSSLRGSRKGSTPRCLELALLAKEFGAFVTTGTDAHFAYDVGQFDEAAELLDKVAIPEDKIVTLSANRFLSFLEIRAKARQDSVAETG